MTEKVLKKKKAKKRPKKDLEKERIFKGLVKLLDEKGLEVRREPLKQGHGWRVSSGACRLNEKPCIFVDRRLPQEEQIEFVLAKVGDLKVEILPEDLQESPLPEKVKKSVCPDYEEVASGEQSAV